MKRRGIRWTAEENQLLDKLRKENRSIEEIAAQLGRTGSSVESRIHWLALTPEQKVRRNLHIQDYRERQKYRGPTQQANRAEATTKPCPLVLAERDYRLSLAPRDLTAALMGDPAIGRSALDRR